jgi:hypothetical protein
MATVTAAKFIKVRSFHSFNLTGNSDTLTAALFVIIDSDVEPDLFPPKNPCIWSLKVTAL